MSLHRTNDTIPACSYSLRIVFNYIRRVIKFLLSWIKMSSSANIACSRVHFATRLAIHDKKIHSRSSPSNRMLTSITFQGTLPWASTIAICGTWKKVECIALRRGNGIYTVTRSSGRVQKKAIFVPIEQESQNRSKPVRAKFVSNDCVIMIPKFEKVGRGVASWHKGDAGNLSDNFLNFFFLFLQHHAHIQRCAVRTCITCRTWCAINSTLVTTAEDMATSTTTQPHTPSLINMKFCTDDKVWLNSLRVKES